MRGTTTLNGYVTDRGTAAAARRAQLSGISPIFRQAKCCDDPSDWRNSRFFSLIDGNLIAETYRMAESYGSAEARQRLQLLDNH